MVMMMMMMMMMIYHGNFITIIIIIIINNRDLIKKNRDSFYQNPEHGGLRIVFFMFLWDVTKLTMDSGLSGNGLYTRNGTFSDCTSRCIPFIPRSSLLFTGK